MALTATATDLVRQDIIRSLGIENCCKFTGSFNRKNLHYMVMQKHSFKKTVDEMSDWINKYYPKQSGIVYCFSKKDCEKMAAALQVLFQNIF
jgi:superfamily II DNA helicase RecQ